MSFGNVFILSRFDCLIVILCLLSLTGCTEKYNSPSKGENMTISISLNHTRNDTLPFCKIGVVDKKINSSTSVERNLKFTFSEFRELIIENPYFYKFNKVRENKYKSDNIKILFGYNDSKEKVICFDLNNNNKFIDDPFYIIENNMPFFEIKNLNSSVNDTLQKRSLHIQPDGRALLTNQGKFGIAFYMMPQFYIDTIEIASGNYIFSLFNNSALQVYSSENTRLIITPYGNPLLPCTYKQVQYKVSDTIYLGNNIFRWDSVSRSGSRLFFKNLGLQNKQFGVQINDFAFPINETDILTEKKYSTDSIKKYILFDFWGTWCVPCRALTPKLLSLNQQKGKYNFEIISIAYDRSLNPVLNYVQKNKMNWIHFFDKNSDSKICSKFKIDDFPTFILTDESGKIIKRGVGEESLSDIQDFLFKN